MHGFGVSSGVDGNIQVFSNEHIMKSSVFSQDTPTLLCSSLIMLLLHMKVMHRECLMSAIRQVAPEKRPQEAHYIPTLNSLIKNAPVKKPMNLSPSLLPN